MVICSSCGTENQDNSKFCQNCGCSLEIQSNIIHIKKTNQGNSKASSLATSREERFRKAKLVALKAIKELETSEDNKANEVVYIGEKIL